MAYQRVTLSTGASVGDPGPLPAALVGLSDASLADLPQAIDPCPDEWANTGFRLVANPEPEAQATRMLPIAQFLLRIPFPKLVAIQTAAATQPAIQVIMKVVDLLKDIDLDNPQTAGLLDVLVAAKLIDATDKAAALA